MTIVICTLGKYTRARETFNRVVDFAKMCLDRELSSQFALANRTSKNLSLVSLHMITESHGSLVAFTTQSTWERHKITMNFGKMASHARMVCKHFRAMRTWDLTLSETCRFHISTRVEIGNISHIFQRWTVSTSLTSIYFLPMSLMSIYFLPWNKKVWKKSHPYRKTNLTITK